MNMMLPGAVYQPADITLMRSALDNAIEELPPYCIISRYNAALAERILRHVALGERDLTKLKTTALLEVIGHSLVTHDISPERRVV
jgi:hypothetical protein